MIKMYRQRVFVFVALSIFINHVYAECSKSVVSIGESIFVLSDERAIANTARERCRSSGGKLAEAKDEATKEELIYHLKNKYIKGLNLETVFIYENTRKPWTFLYQTEESPVYDWIRAPSKSYLSRFMLYRKPTTGFSKSIRFCTNKGYRGTVDRKCEEDPIHYFDLYGADTSVYPSTTYLYNFFRNVTGEEGSWLSCCVGRQPTEYMKLDDAIYVPFINVFIGARSEKGQEEYYWENGEISDTEFYGTYKQTCNQMTIPLTIYYGAYLYAVDCIYRQAFYACEYKYQRWLVEAKDSICNGTTIRLTWNCTTFQEITNFSLDLRLYFTVWSTGKLFRSGSVPYLQSELVLSNLKSRTHYTVKASINFDGCNRTDLSNDTISIVTGDPPADVQNAYLESTFDGKCAVVWTYVPPGDKRTMSYKIRAVSSTLTTTMNVENPSTIQSYSDDTFREIVDLSRHVPGSRLQLTIQAHSCAGYSTITNVKGYYVVPNTITSESELDVGSIAAWVSSFAGLVTAIITVIYCLQKHGYCRRQDKNAYDADENAGPSSCCYFRMQDFCNCYISQDES